MSCNNCDQYSNAIYSNAVGAQGPQGATGELPALSWTTLTNVFGDNWGNFFQYFSGGGWVSVSGSTNLPSANFRGAVLGDVLFVQIEVGNGLGDFTLENAEALRFSLGPLFADQLGITASGKQLYQSESKNIAVFGNKAIGGSRTFASQCVSFYETTGDFIILPQSGLISAPTPYISIGFTIQLVSI